MTEPGERLQERIAAARESIEANLRDALVELEHEEAALRSDPVGPTGAALDEQVEAAAAAAVERLARQLDERIAHVDRALALIGESEQRMIALGDRIGEAARRVTEALEVAGRAIDCERRIDSALEVEGEIADRLVAAERRLAGALSDEPVS